MFSVFFPWGEEFITLSYFIKTREFFFLNPDAHWNSCASFTEVIMWVHTHAYIKPIVRSQNLHFVRIGQVINTEGAKNHRTRLGCHKLTTLATYNGWSSSSENRLQEFEEELERINCDILGLCKGRRKGEENTNFASAHLLYYRDAEVEKTNGDGFFINKRWKNHIVEYNRASDRVARLVIQVSRRCKLQITQFYAPTISYIHEETEDFYEEVALMQ